MAENPTRLSGVEEDRLSNIFFLWQRQQEELEGAMARAGLDDEFILRRRYLNFWNMASEVLPGVWMDQFEEMVDINKFK